MNTAAPRIPLLDASADPLDFSLADRLPALPAGRGRLVLGAAPPDGRPGLLFVPGAYHGAWCYAHYLAYFAAAGLACAALDVRGHGALAQDATFPSTTIADLGQDVADALDALAGPVVVVGHSMGALPALLAARRRPVWPASCCWRPRLPATCPVRWPCRPFPS
ncbi:alpha/beta fold hydrolase [Achromobacter denitrificans]|uniref:alpha/beta fold hydrolase n=1 Tax=Achromobacter denitrificans TaxID=32002 RepID=UPI00240E8B2B|nr:alpha/beta fold hydrolase [Achromobacter denitrificans]